MKARAIGIGLGVTTLLGLIVLQGCGSGALGPNFTGVRGYGAFAAFAIPGEFSSIATDGQFVYAVIREGHIAQMDAASGRPVDNAPNYGRITNQEAVRVASGSPGVVYAAIKGTPGTIKRYTSAPPSVLQPDNGWQPAAGLTFNFPTDAYTPKLGAAAGSAGLAVGSGGGIYVADMAPGGTTARLTKLTSGGQLDTTFNGGQFTLAAGINVAGLAVDSDGNLYVVGHQGGNIPVFMKFRSNGTLDSGLTISGLTFPTDVAVRGSGSARTIYISDSASASPFLPNVVHVYDGAGNLQFDVGPVVGSGKPDLRNPLSVAVDSAGRLSVADRTQTLSFFGTNPWPSGVQVFTPTP